MNKIITISMSMLTILVMSFSLSDTNKSLKGKVKSSIVTDYFILWVNASQPQIKWASKELEKYDTSGNVLLVEKYNSHNLWRDRSIFLYNDKGLLTRFQVYKRPFAKDSILTNYIIYTYDSLGNKTAYDSISNGGTKILKTENKLNDSVVRIAESALWLDDTGSLIKPLKTHQYDKKRNKRATSVDENGYKHFYKYNKKGYIKEYGIYLPDGTLEIKHVLSPSKNGDEIDKEYDAKGLKDITISKYSYDKVGNWLIDSVFDNDRLIYIKKRELEYW